MKKILPLFAVAILLSPTLAAAQTTAPLQNFLDGIGGIIGQLLPIAFALALLFFFWNIIKFIFSLGQGTDSKEAGRGGLFWGIVALFVLASVWGIVEMLGQIFGVEQGGSADVPGIEFPEDE